MGVLPLRLGHCAFRYGDDKWGEKEAQLMRHVNHLMASEGKTQ